MEIKVAISNRHVHLTQEDYKILFGHEPLVKEYDLSQYGEFASTAYVTLKTPKSTIEHVRVVGPIRQYTQVEISKTDAYSLGLNPPARNSGELEGSAPITIVGPNGEVNKDKGCILAARHIHIPQEEVEKYGLTHNQLVSVRVNTEKGGTMDYVSVKVGNYFYEMHIDTDDGNAFLLKTGDTVQIIK
ncbi:MAG: phosphate propanoyltransferase [Bacilli bacterium]|nr:phosphate propanoyltransferase [Bacilli bacterium]